jgi:hypothetical protein
MYKVLSIRCRSELLGSIVTFRDGALLQARAAVDSLQLSKHGGSKASEQRPSVGPSTQLVCITQNWTEKEGNPMAVKNTSKAPKPHGGFSNLLLLVLHVGVLYISLWVHPVSFTLADGTLPHAYS